MENHNLWNDLVNELYKERGFVNICYEALDKHIEKSASGKIALRFIPENWTPQNKNYIDISYDQLLNQTIKFAHLLKSLSLEKGDVVFTLSPRIPEVYITALGALRSGMVFCPLFSSFGPDPIKTRMKRGKGKVLFTLTSLYIKKILPIKDKLVDLKHVILIDDDGNLNKLENVIDFHQAMSNSPNTPIIEKTSPEDAALLHFTSGTTGEPKGAVHNHKSVVYHKISGEFALDLRSTDQFWCTADPGWVTGTSYGIIAPLTIGSTILIDGREFNAKRWFDILENININVWYTSPTALRMLMKMKQDDSSKIDLSHIRFSATVGEPLNPQVIRWAKETLQITLHDNWWQTETGGIMICNDANSTVRPGSMGRSVPGIEVAIIKEHRDSKIIFASVDEKGEIAIKKNWPSIFFNYLDNTQKYNSCFVDGWYLSGDLAYKDKDGYFWFIGRIDDVIKTSGHLVGPFEIENVLMGHKAVLESAVIGIPDQIAGEMIKAFVVLKKGYTPDSEIISDLLAFCRKRLGISISPRVIECIDNLPKTRSGKIMRRLLKARELGMPEGDLSTLERDFDSK